MTEQFVVVSCLSIQNAGMIVVVPAVIITVVGGGVVPVVAMLGLAPLKVVTIRG